MQFQYAKALNEKFEYPKNPSFGTVQVPLMLSTEIELDQTHPKEVLIGPTQNLSLSPFSSILHYGQSIFEGLKVYRTSDDRVAIFQLDDHVRRFNNSARIMCMPIIEEAALKEMFIKYVESVKDYVPREENHSLYLRPIMFANDDEIKVKVASKCSFMIISSIVGDYFAGKEDKKTRVLVSTKFARAFRGGTGEAKTAANYSLSLPALRYANKLGYQQVIYLDSQTRSTIEELGGMNFFWVENNTLHTPRLNGQILHGITRKTILEIAKELGIKTSESDLTLEELISKTNSGEIKEVFASGTAAAMTPLNEIGVSHDDESVTKLEYSEFGTMERIKKHLLATHRGETGLSSKYLYYLRN